VSIFFPAFIFFRFIYVLPAFYLVAAWGSLNGFKIFKPILVIGLIGVNLIGTSIYFFDKNQHRENWREATRTIENNLKSGDIVVFTNPEPFAPYQWYEKIPEVSFGATDSVSANEDKTIDKTLEIIEGRRGVYYFEYLSDLHDPQNYVENTIKELGYKEDKIYDFSKVGQVYYYKKD
jgi:hypothetical protein